MVLQLTWLDCTIVFCKLVAMTHIVRPYLTLQQSVFVVIVCIQNLPFFLLFDLLFLMFFYLQRNYRIRIIFIGPWVVKFMTACSAIKLLSFYKIGNSKRDNLFDFLRNLLILTLGSSIFSQRYHKYSVIMTENWPTMKYMDLPWWTSLWVILGVFLASEE